MDNLEYSRRAKQIGYISSKVNIDFMKKRLPFSAFMVVVILILGFSAACQPSVLTTERGDPSSLSILENIGDINQTLSLDPLGKDEAEQLGTFVIKVENAGGQPIEFPPGFGALGYEYVPSRNDWIEHPNSVTSPDLGILLQERSAAPENTSVVYYYPADRTSISSDSIWLVVVGTKLGEDGMSAEQVAAYTLLDLSVIDFE